MKGTLTAVLALMPVLATFGLTAFAADTDAVEVYVTVSDENGELAVTQEKIQVTDVDNDGAITVNDALYCAHEAEYEGGAEAGYASSAGSYGLALDKLWGVANGGSYGFYVNNASAMNLTDRVADGDYVQAYVYTDLVGWSDTFCFFNANEASVEAGEALELTLSASGYDADWNPITLAVAEAAVSVNGTATEVKTDSEGKAVLTFDKAGTYVISAESETMTLVPPVCVVTVTEKATDAPESSDESAAVPAGDRASLIAFAVIALLAVSGAAVAVKNRQ